MVESPAGAVVIAGQAVLTVAEWTGSADETVSGEPPEGDDRRHEYRASVARLRALGPVRVHFVHDPGVWEAGA